jgi:SAM-dependent methyltransferase
VRDDIRKLPEIYRLLAEQDDKPLATLGWPPNPDDLAERHKTLLSAVEFPSYTPERPLKILDLGCGLGLLLDYLTANSLIGRIDYTGVDLLEPILHRARQRWPDHRFELRDVRDEPFACEEFDYCIMCGLFTIRNGNSYEDAVELVQSTLKAVWPSVRLGLGFNSMSKHVDWERDDLFHWPLDDIMAFCKQNLSRHVSLHLDYGLWEVSTIVRKSPRSRGSRVPANW